MSYLYFLKRNVFVKRKNINNLFSLIVNTIDSIPKCSFGLQDDITLYSFGFIIILSNETNFYNMFTKYTKHLQNNKTLQFQEKKFEVKFKSYSSHVLISN